MAECRHIATIIIGYYHERRRSRIAKPQIKSNDEYLPDSGSCLFSIIICFLPFGGKGAGFEDGRGGVCERSGGAEGRGGLNGW